MQTFTEIVAAVVIHASAVAYSHLGVLVEPQQPERAVPTERKVARSVQPGPALEACDAPRPVPPNPGVPLSLGRA